MFCNILLRHMPPHRGFTTTTTTLQCVNGNRLHVRGHVVEKKQEVQGKGLTRDRSSGTVNLKSISVNDLLDQHLSKLTLGLVVDSVCLIFVCNFSVTNNSTKVLSTK